MIRTRNQNKITVQNIQKQKNQKKVIDKKKERIQTTSDTQQQRASLVLTPIKVAQKSSPSNYITFKPQPDQSSEYIQQILQYLKQQQKKYKINQNYIKYQKKLNSLNRAKLIKHIYNICLRYKCKRKTLYLAVHCLDSYFSKHSNLQNYDQFICISQAAIFIAMKHEEIYPPQLKEWTFPANAKRIYEIQAKMLKEMDFRLNVPSIVYFDQYLNKYFFQNKKVNKRSKNQQQIQLLSDLCLFEVTLYQFQPYDIAVNIRNLVYGIQPQFKDQRLSLNIKWTIQRSAQHIDWLKQKVYKDIR